MAELLLVPEVAAGATEVVLAEWLAKPGDAFTAGDAIAVLETEKAVVEVEAEGDATLLTTLVAAGKQISVGSPMALLGTAEELEADLDALLARLGAEVAVGTPAPALREVPDTEEESPAPGQPPAPQVQARPATHDEATTVPGERLFISPLARRMLAEAGIDPHQVAGSGPRGAFGGATSRRRSRSATSSRPPIRRCLLRRRQRRRPRRVRPPDGQKSRTRGRVAQWLPGSPGASRTSRTSTSSARR